jgi:3-oxoacyl-[acyl-carrier protein] reductase
VGDSCGYDQIVSGMHVPFEWRCRWCLRVQQHGNPAAEKEEHLVEGVALWLHPKRLVVPAFDGHDSRGGQLQLLRTIRRHGRDSTRPLPDLQIRGNSISQARFRKARYPLSMTEHANPGAIIVTGAGRGLGRGVALELAAAGYSVVINYRGNAEAAQRTAEECAAAADAATSRSVGLSTHPSDQAGAARFPVVQGDVSVAADRERLVATTIAECGGITGLVNNAGIAPRERNDIVEATEASFEEVLRTNLQGPYFLTQLVARHWLSASSPGNAHRAIVFVTSISATTVSINRGEYCVSKAGLSMAAQLWATRLAPHGIGVYEIRPGIMETDMTSGVKEKYDRLIADGLVPQQRWGRPEDIGRAARAFLAGDFAFSPGAVVYSDGGLSIPRL